jgi:hypothetical protein
MDGVKLLAKARSAGLTVEADGDRLVIKGPKGAKAMVQELTEHKAAVLLALASDGLPAQQHDDPDAGEAKDLERRRTVQEHQAAADLSSTDPPEAPCNVGYCAVIRLMKALLAAAVTTGIELGRAHEEMNTSFPMFIGTKTPWTLPAARAMVRFAAEAGLQADRLTPADDVALEQMLEKVALLGGLYLAEIEQGHDDADEE